MVEVFNRFVVKSGAMSQRFRLGPQRFLGNSSSLGGMRHKGFQGTQNVKQLGRLEGFRP